MTKILDAYTAIPVSDEGSAEKAVIPIAIALVAGALAITGFNAVKGNVADTMDQNIGDAVYKQVTGFDKSSDTYEQLQSGFIDLQIPAIQIDNRTK